MLHVWEPDGSDSSDLDGSYNLDAPSGSDEESEEYTLFRNACPRYYLDGNPEWNGYPGMSVHTDPKDGSDLPGLHVLQCRLMKAPSDSASTIAGKAQKHLLQVLASRAHWGARIQQEINPAKSQKHSQQEQVQRSREVSTPSLIMS